MNGFQFTLFWINLYAFTFYRLVLRHTFNCILYLILPSFSIFFFSLFARPVPFFVPPINIYMFLQIENVSVRWTSMRIHFVYGHVKCETFNSFTTEDLAFCIWIGILNKSITYLKSNSLCNDILALFWDVSTEISFQNLRPLATEFGDVFAHKKSIFDLH